MHLVSGRAGSSWSRIPNGIDLGNHEDPHGTAAVRQVRERAKEIGKGWEIQQVSFDEDFNRTGSKRKPCTQALALLVRCQLLPKQLSNCSYREPKDITKQNYPRRN